MEAPESMTSLMVITVTVTVTAQCSTVPVQQMYLHEGGHGGPRVDDELDGDNSNSNSNSNSIMQYSTTAANVPA